MLKNQGPGEIAQLVKCVPRKRGDPCKTLRHGATCCSPRTEKVEAGGSFSAQVCQSSLKEHNASGMTSELLSSDLYTHVHVHTYTPTQNNSK